MEWIGSLDGNVNAVIRPQVTGYLIKQNYREGDLVKQGQPLFEIDPRTFEAAVDEAKGLRAQQAARYETTKANLARIKPLAAMNAVSQKDLDDATGADLSAKASLEAAEASLRTAKLNLGFTKITSPVTGIAGIAKAQIGDLLSPSMPTELTTVSTVDPIKVYFNISEREYLKLPRGLSLRAPAGARCRSSCSSSTARSTRTRESSSCSTGRSTRAPAPSRSQPCSRIPTTCCAPASTARYGQRWRSTRARCWCRNARSPKSRASTWWPWSAPTTRSTSVR
jgi:RND family efflux transporter MFP subunit